MAAHRRYCFTRVGYPEGAHEKIREVLDRWCERKWWYQEPEVEGAPFNRLVITLTVTGRDQWWCHRRAMWLVLKCYRSIHLKLQDVPEPDWETLAPHINRGYRRRAKAAEPAQPAAPAPPG